METSEPEDLIFTRKDLQDLRAAVLQKQHEDAVRKLAGEIRGGVLNTAMNTNERSYFYSIYMPTDEKDKRYKVIEDTLYSLSRSFPGVTIIYRTRPRYGIYIDWGLGGLDAPSEPEYYIS